MSRDKQRLVDYLGHILEAIARIQRYTEDVTDWAFMQNELLQDAVIRNFEIIGEASRNIERHYPEFAAAHPEVPLSFAYEMRNALAHGYFKVDLEIVWKTIERDLPVLASQVQILMAEVTQNLDRRACAEFCVNGPLAGNCRIVRSPHVYQETQHPR